MKHDWVESKLNHGEKQCSRCLMTNREAWVLGDECPGVTEVQAVTPAMTTLRFKSADGKLFNAAPELLTILKRILYAHDTDNCGAANGEAVLCKHFADAARAAIAKAEV